MSADRDEVRIVRSWLEDGVTALPDRVLDAVLNDLPTTRQRGAGWLTRRFPVMNNNVLSNTYVRIGLAAVVVVLAILAAVRLLPVSNTGAERESTPSPTPLATTSPSPVPTPTSVAIGIPGLAGAEVLLTVPANWTPGGWYVNNGADAYVAVYPVENVYSDPCHWQGSLPDPPVGPSVDDLATALASQPTRDATTSDVTLGGYSGKVVRMSVPADISFSDCDLGIFGSWSEAGVASPSRYHQVPGQRDDVYILDVEGTRAIIDVSWYPNTSAAKLADIEGILGALTIEP